MCDREHATRLFRTCIDPNDERYTDDMTMPTLLDVMRFLPGKDLMCWCPLDQPCHADVLLEIANELPAGHVTP